MDFRPYAELVGEFGQKVKERLLRDITEITAAMLRDAAVSTISADTLRRIAEMVNFTGFPITGDDPYEILGLNRTASDEEVKHRYRELLMRIHPDTAGKKGSEFLTKMVNIAYNQIGKERGWK